MEVNFRNRAVLDAEGIAEVLLACQECCSSGAQRILFELPVDADFNMTFIDRDFPDRDHPLFDTVYMRALFDHGARLGRTGDFWSKRPPDEDK